MALKSHWELRFKGDDLNRRWFASATDLVCRICALAGSQTQLRSGTPQTVAKHSTTGAY